MSRVRDPAPPGVFLPEDPQRWNIHRLEVCRVNVHRGPLSGWGRPCASTHASAAKNPVCWGKRRMSGSPPPLTLTQTVQAATGTTSPLTPNADGQTTTLESVLAVEGLSDEIMFRAAPDELIRLADTQQAAQRALESDAYWQLWLDPELAVAEPGSVNGGARTCVTEWRNDALGDWFCYWSGDYGMPTDRVANYVFDPPLECAPTSLVIRPRAWDLRAGGAAAASEVYVVLKQLVAIVALQGGASRAIGWGDEGDGQWLPFMMPWNRGEDLTPEALLAALGAHPEIRSRVLFRSVVDPDDQIEDEEEPLNNEWGAAQRRFRLAIVDFLSHRRLFLEGFSPFPNGCVFHAGSDQLNPVVCFAVAKVREGLVAGFIGGITHT